MDNRDSQFAKELRKNPELIRRVMNSRDGQTLMKLLTESDGGGQFRQAVQSAAEGDASEMARCLRQVTESREGAALIARLQRMMGQ